jgi:hypothetical protein
MLSTEKVMAYLREGTGNSLIKAFPRKENPRFLVNSQPGFKSVNFQMRIQ